ncbi:MAG TPA: hypothetical protein VFZ65_18020 [Planctomycetota bacterium]|nr:hypothetical protein [Planctomycetota bacterium]
MNSRRTFLAGLGAAALVPASLPAALPAALPVALPGRGPCAPPATGEYVVGVTSNPLLPGPAGELVLRTWLSVAADGTGFGILTDRYGPGSSSHLAVQSAVRNGHNYTWQGVVTRSNEPLLVGQPFTLSAHVQGGIASLDLVLMGQTFSGQGRITD